MTLGMSMLNSTCIFSSGHFIGPLLSNAAPYSVLGVLELKMLSLYL